MEEVKADVEPFPFVPATWIGFKRFRSDGCKNGHDSQVSKSHSQLDHERRRSSKKKKKLENND